MSPLLTYRQLGSSGPALICLHGLYGYGRNWNSIARQLSAQFRVILPDLRNHGKSFHAEPWDYAAMAQDVAELAKHLELESFSLMGHSMGGKVAMQYALSSGSTSLEHLVIVDIAPRPYEADYHRGLLQALLNLDLAAVQEREDADAALAEAIPEAKVRSFLLSNLVRTEAGWAWQFNLPLLHDRIELITANIDASSAPFSACPVLFIAGSDSDYVSPKDEPQIKALFPQARLEWIADAGHWVHVDQPDALLKSLLSFMSPAPAAD
jgi:esterase